MLFFQWQSTLTDKNRFTRHPGTLDDEEYAPFRLPVSESNLGHRPAVESITCGCGSKIPIPDNPTGAQTITTPCLKCKAHWVFHYDAEGRYLNLCQKGLQNT